MPDRQQQNGAQRWIRRVALIGGACLLLTARFWGWDDPYGDARRVLVTVALVLLVSGLVLQLPPRIISRPWRSAGASGSALVATGVLLLAGSLLLFQMKTWMFLGAAGSLAALFVIGVGAARLFRGRRS